MANEDPPGEGEEDRNKPVADAPSSAQEPPPNVPAGPDSGTPASTGARLSVVPPPLEAPRIGKAKRSLGRQNTVTLAQYEQMWEAYRAGTRQAMALARACGVGRRSAQRAIERGWAENQWPPFRERIKMLDREREKAEAAAALEKFRETVDEFYGARRRNLKASEEATSLIFAMLRKCMSVVEASTFIEYRRVTEVLKDKDGNFLNGGKPVTHDKPYVSAKNLAAAVRACTTAARDIGVFQKTWLMMGRAGLDTVRPDGVPETESSPASPIKPMTADQLKWMSDNNGQLPEGCTDEQFMASARYLFSTGTGT